MNKILSFILVSALIFSASAGGVEVAVKVLEGFTMGLNHAELNPAIENCTKSLNDTRYAAAEAMEATDNKEGDVFEQATAKLGYNVAHTIKVCGNVLVNVESLFHSLAEEIKKLDGSVLSQRLFANVFQFNMKVIQIKTSYDNKDFKAVGQGIAEIFKTLVYGTDGKTIRQLSADFEDKVDFDSNATFLGVLGFLEEANTTIVVNDYLVASNDTTTLVAQALTLKAAIEKMDFATIMATLNSLNNSFMVLAADVNVLKGEVTQFVQRDLPLFNTPEKMAKAVQSLLTDLPTTLMTVQRITNAYKNADYREVGHGTGAFYNQLRKGAMTA